MKSIFLCAALAACGGGQKSSPPPAAPAAAPAPAPAPAPADKPTVAAIDSDMIRDATRPLLPKIKECGEHAPKVKGTVKIKASVDPDGKVTATVDKTPDAALGECVVGVMQTASFPKTIAGGNFSYPFVF